MSQDSYGCLTRSQWQIKITQLSPDAIFRVGSLATRLAQFASIFSASGSDVPINTKDVIGLGMDASLQSLVFSINAKPVLYTWIGQRSSRIPLQIEEVLVDLQPAQHVPLFRDTRRPTMARTRRPTVARTRRPTVAWTRRPTIVWTRRPTPTPNHGGGEDTNPCAFPIPSGQCSVILNVQECNQGYSGCRWFRKGNRCVRSRKCRYVTASPFSKPPSLSPTFAKPTNSPRVATFVPSSGPILVDTRSPSPAPRGACDFPPHSGECRTVTDPMSCEHDFTGCRWYRKLNRCIRTLKCRMSTAAPLSDGYPPSRIPTWSPTELCQLPSNGRQCSSILNARACSEFSGCHWGGAPGSKRCVQRPRCRGVTHSPVSSPTMEGFTYQPSISPSTSSPTNSPTSTPTLSPTITTFPTLSPTTPKPSMTPTPLPSSQKPSLAPTGRCDFPKDNGECSTQLTPRSCHTYSGCRWLKSISRCVRTVKCRETTAAPVTMTPSETPSVQPSRTPTHGPTSSFPSLSPTTEQPSKSPIPAPTRSPTFFGQTYFPTPSPTVWSCSIYGDLTFCIGNGCIWSWTACLSPDDFKALSDEDKTRLMGDQSS